MPLTIHDFLPINSFKDVAASPRITVLTLLAGACQYHLLGMSKSLFLSGAVLAANLYMRYQDEWVTPQNFSESLDSLHSDLIDSFNQNAFDLRKSRLIRRYNSLQGTLASMQDQTPEFISRVEKLSMIKNLIVLDKADGKNWNDLSLDVENLDREVELSIKENRYLDEKENFVEKYKEFQAKASASPERLEHSPAMQRQLASLSSTLTYSFALPHAFREVLSYWGRASCAEHFKVRVKETGFGEILEIVDNLLVNHEREWGAKDLDYLVRIQGHLRDLGLKSTALEKIIPMLKETRNLEELERGASLETAMNLSLLNGGEAITSQELSHFVHNSSSKEMGDFVAMLEKTRQQNHRRSAGLIQTFFLHANSQDQARFFAEVSKIESRDILLGHVFLALPREISELNLSSCAMLKDRHIELLMDKRFPGLKSLDISNCPLITDAAIQMLTKNAWMASLNRLILGGSEEITDLSIERIAKSPHMRGLIHLSCIKCSKLTDNSLVSLSRSPYVRLQGLFFENCWFYDKGVETLVKSAAMKSLNEISFRFCPRLSSRSLQAIAESPHMSNLVMIDFSKSLVSDAGVMAIAESPILNKMRKLFFSCCDMLTDISFESIAKSPYMINLEELRARTCYHLTDRTIQAIAKSPYMDNLVLVDFNECDDLTNQSLEALYRNPRKLKQAFFDDCERVSERAVAALQKKLRTSGPFQKFLK